MPQRFTTGDIKEIARRLGLERVKKGSKTWNGIDINGNFLQTYIHDHGDGVQVLSGTARRMAEQLNFKDVADMYDFLHDSKRRR